MGGTSVAALGCRLIFDAVLEPFEEAACVFWVESSFVSTFGGRLRPSKSARSAFAHCRRLRGRHAESPARGEGVKHCAARTAAPARCACGACGRGCRALNNSCIRNARDKILSRLCTVSYLGLASSSYFNSIHPISYRTTSPCFIHSCLASRPAQVQPCPIGTLVSHDTLPALRPAPCALCSWLRPAAAAAAELVTCPQSRPAHCGRSDACWTLAATANARTLPAMQRRPSLPTTPTEHAPGTHHNTTDTPRLLTRDTWHAHVHVHVHVHVHAHVHVHVLLLLSCTCQHMCGGQAHKASTMVQKAK